MSKAGQTGVSAKTSKRIGFGAGTIHQNLKLDLSNLENSIIGATKEGSKLEITPKFYDIEADGALVKVKGLSNKKVGETAKLTVNFLEIDLEIWRKSLVATMRDSNAEDGEASGYKVLESKSDVDDNDYMENISFVGLTMNNYPIIAILPNAFCTSGLNLETKNAEEIVGEHEWECHAGLEDDLTKLPWKIFTNDPNLADIATPTNATPTPNGEGEQTA